MNSDISIREAIPEDRIAFWEWYRDALTFQTARGMVTMSRRDHDGWFSAIRHDPNRILLVGVFETLRIGSVRFDQRKRGFFDVHVYVKPAYSAQGLGAQMLGAAVSYLKDLLPVTNVTARVGRVTPALEDFFLRAGFAPAGEGCFELTTASGGRPDGSLPTMVCA